MRFTGELRAAKPPKPMADEALPFAPLPGLSRADALIAGLAVSP
jgi:hypothetical protein